MKKITLILLLALLPQMTFAAPVSWDGNTGTNILQPLQSLQGATIKGNNFVATSTSATSTLPRLEVNTALNLFGTFANSLDDLCLAITGGSGLCDGSDATGGGSSGGLATTTPWTASDLVEVTDNGTVQSTSTPTVDTITTNNGTSTISQLNITTAFDFLGDYITNVTTWFRAKVDTYLTGGTGITVSSGDISFDCSEVEGTGINCVGEAITLDATGDWTGTFDGVNGADYALESELHSAVTLSGVPDYITLVGQDIVRGTIDIGDDTNLVGGTNLTLTGDTLDVDDAFLLNTGDTATGDYNFDSGTLFVDGTNNRVGVATTTPAFDFQVGDLGANTYFSAQDGISTSSVTGVYGSEAGTQNPVIRFLETIFLGFRDSDNEVVFATDAGLTDPILELTTSKAAQFYGNVQIDGNATSTGIHSFGTNLTPDTNDGAGLGISGLAFSDLFLASGSVINWLAGDLTLTHAANLLTLAGGGLDLGGADSLEVPNGTGPTVDAAGEIALDTTDNQVLVGDSGNAVFVAAKKVDTIWKATIASTSPAFISGGLLKVPTELDGYTMTAIRCSVQGGTSKIIAVEDESANSTEDITCAATVTSDDGTITNAAATAAEEMYIDFGATSGAVDYVSISVFGTWTRE